MRPNRTKSCLSQPCLLALSVASWSEIVMVRIRERETRPALVYELFCLANECRFLKIPKSGWLWRRHRADATRPGVVYIETPKVLTRLGPRILAFCLTRCVRQLSSSTSKTCSITLLTGNIFPVAKPVREGGRGGDPSGRSYRV